MKPNVITITAASEEKSCSRHAVYNAIARGDLNTVQVGRYQMIVKDRKYAAYAPKQAGGRTHQRFKKREEG